MQTISFFEIPVDNFDKAQKFYSELFDWRFERSPLDMDYWLIKTKGEEEKGINGGMMRRQTPSQLMINYITVSSVDEYIVRIENLGGEVIVPKTSVLMMGYFAICKDTENSHFGIWEDNKEAKV